MKITTSLVLLLFFAVASFGQTVAFVDVNVIPMDKERVLRNQTVIVRDGVIAEIGDARRVKPPSGAQRIDGAGKFLIPGLTDMHVHLFTDDEFPDALAEDEFKIMIAYGVTTIRLDDRNARATRASSQERCWRDSRADDLRGESAVYRTKVDECLCRNH